jgi:hypothetical protein
MICNKRGELLDVAFARDDGTFDLSGSDLSYSNLRGSNLSGSNLSGSNLSGSNLSGSNLRGSDLSGSNLSGSNLSYSNLSGSNLSGSDLSGSNLWDLGQDQRGYRFSLFFDAGTKTFTVKAGCRSFTLAEAHDHWLNRHADDPLLRTEILARIAMAQAISDAVLKGGE